MGVSCESTSTVLSLWNRVGLWENLSSSSLQQQSLKRLKKYLKINSYWKEELRVLQEATKCINIYYIVILYILALMVSSVFEKLIVRYIFFLLIFFPLAPPIFSESPSPLEQLPFDSCLKDCRRLELCRAQRQHQESQGTGDGCITWRTCQVPESDNRCEWIYLYVLGESLHVYKSSKKSAVILSWCKSVWMSMSTWG